MALKEKPPADRNALKTSVFGSKTLYPTPSRQTTYLRAESEGPETPHRFLQKKKRRRPTEKKKAQEPTNLCSPANAPLLQTGGVVAVGTQGSILGGRRSRLVAMLHVSFFARC